MTDYPTTLDSFQQEEQRVVAQSAAFKKELGLRDLVLTQIVFVVGTSWVGTAAKLGPAQTVYWLLAILLFYLPVAAVVIYLNRIMPLEGGLYQWAKLGFNEFAGFIVAWNLWLLGISVMAGTGLVVATNLAYALGPAWAWLPQNRLVVGTLNGVLIGALILVTIRGLSLGKWVHNAGAILLLVTYGAVIVLPFLAVAAGKLPAYRPIEWVFPTASLFSLNIFSKMALGALSGFEYVAILAGETRAPVKNIGRSVLIAAPIIALMFILGTSSVMAFVQFADLDLIGPVPQALSAGANAFGAAGTTIAAIAILMLAGRSIAVLSIYFTGNTRLPMVAGWDAIVPAWFSKLEPRYKTPVNSILFVGVVTLAFAIASLIGVGAQEAFQLIDNAAGIFYAIAYMILFAIPMLGLRQLRSRAPIWLQIAAVIGFAVTVLYVALTIFPIVNVQSRLWFAAKLIITTVVANLIGALIFVAGRRRQRRVNDAASLRRDSPSNGV
ncbi:MAG: APC family permease [Chthoniobacterales bacterium]|nr:APC family permease [Chthoniobacterales bacterium]